MEGRGREKVGIEVCVIVFPSSGQLTNFTCVWIAHTCIYMSAV